MDFYIGQIFEGTYPPEAAEWCNNNNAKLTEIDSVVRTVTEEYEEIELVTNAVKEISHIETDEEGNEHVVVDQPAYTELVRQPVTKTREVEKQLRCFQIQAIPEPTVEEKNARIKQTRAHLYASLVDPLHAEKQRKTVLGEWTETNEAEYVEQVKALTTKIQEENPYEELVDNSDVAL